MQAFGSAHTGGFYALTGAMAGVRILESSCFVRALYTNCYCLLLLHPVACFPLVWNGGPNIHLFPMGNVYGEALMWACLELVSSVEA